MPASKKPTGRPKKAPGTKTRDATISFTLFLRPDNHRWLKAQAVSDKMSLQDFIQLRALQGQADGNRRSADHGFTKPRRKGQTAEPVQLDVEVESLKKEVEELKAAKVQIDLKTATDQEVVAAALPIIHAVALRNRLMLNLDDEGGQYVPISMVTTKGAVSGGDEVIFLNPDEGTFVSGDESERIAELERKLEVSQKGLKLFQELSANYAKLEAQVQTLQKANQGLADDLKKSREGRQKLVDEITRRTARKPKRGA